MLREQIIVFLIIVLFAVFGFSSSTCDDAENMEVLTECGATRDPNIINCGGDAYYRAGYAPNGNEVWANVEDDKQRLVNCGDVDDDGKTDFAVVQEGTCEAGELSEEPPEEPEECEC